ncbi:MAG: hypothetical protein R3C02_14180 [Planctomycetaceae bacterium]
MARYSIAFLALLSIIGAAAAVPLTAQETDQLVAQGCPTCPSGGQPSYEYSTPTEEYYMPGPSMEGMSSEPTPMDMTPLDSGSSTGVPPAPGQSTDNFTPQFDQGMQGLNSQPPAMATPTFNPSMGGGQTSTAATSPEAAAPNMIGDLFGGSYSGYVPIRVDRFFATTSSPISGPAIDSMSPLSLSASSVPIHPDLIVSRTRGGTSLMTFPMEPVDFTTVDSQAAIVSANPALVGSNLAIVNNPDVQDRAQMVGEAIHGPGTSTYVASESDVEVISHDALLGGEYLPTWAYDYTVLSEVAGISNPGAMPGGNVGRQKIAENSSPLPRDRVYVNYSYFNNTPLTSDGIDVNRVTPGFEKTFFGGDMSIEVRAPFATTLDSDLLSGALGDTSTTEFGNMTVFFKALLWDAGYEAISAGLGVTIPTADDVSLGNVLRVKNESVHFLPFIGALFLPTERLYIQSFLQADIDPNGNTFQFSDFTAGVPSGNLRTIARPNDGDYVYFDVGIGYWIYQAPLCGGACGTGGCGDRHGWVRGIAPTLELHYNGTMNASDTVLVQQGPTAYTIGNGRQSNLDIWNMVLGVNFDLRRNAVLTLAYATPLSNNGREQFDSEFRVMFNWFFGGPDRVASCHF